MLSRVVSLPRDQAIRIAKYEQGSLLLRAKASTKCSEFWHDAALHAGLVVQCLREGDDAGAATHALHVAPRWKKAADCEGWPTPSRTAAPGEINHPIVDTFTLVHFGVGALLSILGASHKQALAVSIGWELFEGPLKRAMPQIFPHATQDTVANKVGDFAANTLGYLAMEKLR